MKITARILHETGVNFCGLFSYFSVLSRKMRTMKTHKNQRFQASSKIGTVPRLGPVCANSSGPFSFAVSSTCRQPLDDGGISTSPKLHVSLVKS